MEKLARACQNIWSHWNNYVLRENTKMIHHPNGDITIPAAEVQRWLRQVDTDYNDLSEKEKESDREVVTMFLSFLLDE